VVQDWILGFGFKLEFYLTLIQNMVTNIYLVQSWISVVLNADCLQLTCKLASRN